MPARSINLLPQKDFDHTLVGRFLRWALTYGRYIIVSTEIIVLMAFIFRFSLDRTITDLNEEIEQKSAIVIANQGFEDRFRNLQNRVNYIGALTLNQNASLVLLNHLETIAPQGIRLTRLILKETTVSLTASAFNSSSLSIFIENLKNSQVLQDITVNTVSKKSTQTGEIEMTIEGVMATNQ